MSRSDRRADRRGRRSVLGVGTATGAAFAAALIGLANAPAATADTDLDPFQDLFGDSGINTWTPAADSSLASIDPTGTLAGNLDTSVDNFIHGMGPDGFADGPFMELVAESDPSAFTSSVEQFGPSDYVSVLIPQDATGDIAQGLDFLGFESGLDTLGNPLNWPVELFALVFFGLLPFGI
jgi:hypothetical protein